MTQRSAQVKRDTLETQISIELIVDGTGKSSFDTGVPFLEHMLEQVARHGLFDLTINAQGDLHIDAHHTVEDIGICCGQALAQAVGDKKGIRRYGHAYVPLDPGHPEGAVWQAEQEEKVAEGRKRSDQPRLRAR